MPYFQTHDGTTLFYRDYGRGRPLLFLNSLGLTSNMWDYQFAAFADLGFRCIGFDRRGHGRSDEPSGGYDVDTLADDVAALIAKLDLSDLTLIGHSMAGGEIVRYLSRHGQERIGRIAFLGATTPMLLHSHDNPTGLPLAAFETTWAAWRLDYAKWVDDNLEPFFVEGTSSGMMHWVANLLQASIPVALACNESMVRADFRSEMREITVPSLIIHGDRDRSAPIDACGTPSACLIPDCRFIVYEDAPHGLIYTHMERLHTDLMQFIRET